MGTSGNWILCINRGFLVIVAFVSSKGLLNVVSRILFAIDYFRQAAVRTIVFGQGDRRKNEK